MSHKVHYMTHYGCFWVWIQFYVRKSVIYNTFSNIKKGTAHISELFSHP